MSLYVCASHYHSYGDVFSDYHYKSIDRVFEEYKDIGFDSIVLDEFKGIVLNPGFSGGYHLKERIYGKSFSKFFDEYTNGYSLERALFDMRYCPIENEKIRINAINLYFEVFRKGILNIEKYVYNKNKEIFGQDAFIGLHNTYHNSLINDEIWHTGCNWWEIPRDYAQTDENISMPIRLGLACCAKHNQFIDMFYSKNEHEFYHNAIYAAPYGGRIHYHGYEDIENWGIDFTSNKTVTQNVSIIEEGIKWLNDKNLAFPKTELLIVFGFPALCNWYPYINHRSNYDINKSMNAENIANDIWNAKITCALAPSEAIDDGRITITSDNKFDFCGKKFNAMLYLYPEYIKESTLEFLKNAVDNSTNLRIAGELTWDFKGEPIKQQVLDRLKPVQSNAFTVDILDSMSLNQNHIENGCILTDGTVVTSSLRENRVVFTVNDEKWERELVL